MPDELRKKQSPDGQVCRPQSDQIAPQSIAKRDLFEQCIDQQSGSLYRVAFRLTGHRDLADELVQETYFSAWKGIESLRDDSKMRGWLFAILRNQYSKLLRKLPKTKSLNEESSEIASPDTSTAEETKLETKELVQSAMEELDDDQKLPMLLVAMEGMSVGEAANVLDIPRGTVLSRLHRGRQKMKQTLIQLGVMDADLTDD